MTIEAVMCYAASEDYMFETVLSASQARQHLKSHYPVRIAFIGRESSQEFKDFTPVCADMGVELVSLDPANLDGLSPKFGRLFLDQVLSEDTSRVLYLDGDTQIVAPIDHLLEADLDAGRALAARDPMTFIVDVHPRIGGNIKSWLNEGAVPSEWHPHYINSGMLALSRSDLVWLRQSMGRLEKIDRKFTDQTAINLALVDKIDHVSMSWNFPGFLIGSPIADAVPPRIVHFMSDPRPWNASFKNWTRFTEPYEAMARRYPTIAKYQKKFDARLTARYRVQQFYKRFSEYPVWSSDRALTRVAQLEKDVRF